MRTFDHKRFTKVRDAHGFLQMTAEASDLDGWPTPNDRVWPDACDVGLRVQGHHFAVDFVVTESKSEEGDLLWWRLRPTRDAERRIPACRGTSILVFND